MALLLDRGFMRTPTLHRNWMSSLLRVVKPRATSMAKECPAATMGVMATPVLDLQTLRKGCAHCSLQQLCLPAGIGVDGLQQLDSIVRRRRPIARGESLFRTGDALSAVFVARDGAFKTISISEDGEERVVGFHLPGELIGLDALGDERHRCDAVALTTANVCEVPFDQLADIASQVPGLQHQLLRVIGRSVGRDQDHLDMLARRQASERIALFLHGLAERFRHIGQADAQFKLPMSREDIARFLGLALETVSRGFTRLQEDGVIEVDGRRITILDRVELDRLAHHPDAADARRRVSG